MKTVFYFLKPYKRLCFFTLLVMIADVAGALYVPKLTADMINIGVSSGNLGYILEKGAAMAGVTLISGAGALTGSYLCAMLCARLGRDIRNAIYEKTLTFSSYDFERFGTGSMITRTLNDVNIVQQAVVWCIQMVLPVPVMCVLGVVMAFAIDRTMGIMLIIITLFIIAFAIFVTRKASFIFEKLQMLLDRMNTVLRENITGVRVIRSFNKERYEEKRMGATFSDYAGSAIKANRLFVSLDSLAFFVINICIVGILWLGGNRVGAGFMEIGDITALTEYSILIMFYIIMAQMVIMLIPRAHICLKRIEEVLSHEPEIRDGSGSLLREDKEREGNAPLEEEAPPESASLEVKEAVHTSAAEERLGNKGEKNFAAAVFKNASFCFADADENTLSDIDFTINRGETTAIIGSTGSGKSTIAKLILRFHDVTSGKVLFNGRDVRELTQRELREHIAYVPQKAWLFSGTIESNLKYGNKNASPADIEKALRTAQADFVSSLPEGINSYVAQGGTNFSGGQKQRLSIARALMKKADLYIFDDSFSALDFKTDAKLRKALAKEVKDSAVLIIAQRINTILNADKIIVLDDGRIVGMGNHDRLMESCPVYRDIARSQMGGGVQNGS